MQTQLHPQPLARQQVAKQQPVPWLGTCCNPARLSRRRHVSAGARRDQQRGRTEQTVTTVVVQPTELLRSDYARTQEKADVPLTVYSCRFSTGHGRGAGFQGDGAVNICLIGRDGRSVLQRICPVNDPQTARQDISEMCQIQGTSLLPPDHPMQIIDDGVGADCPTALGQISPPHSTPSAPSPSGYSLPPKPPPAPRMRFQEGTVDEVVFLAPELGPLSGILVGTESATWVLEELQIASSRTHHIDRFVCRRLLGSQPGQGAVFLQPVPPGAKLYGTGELQLMLTKEQAAALHTLNMEAYHDLKKRLLTTTALLTVSGAGMAGLAAGLEGALPFALGGLAGVVYQWLLQQSVDSIVATATPAPTPPTPAPRVNLQGAERPLATGTALDDPTVFIDFVEVDPDGTIVVQKKGAGAVGAGLPGRNLLGNPAVRIAFIAGLTALAISVMGGTMPEGALGLPLLQRDQMWQLAVAVMGFLTYKIALISVSLSSPPPTDPQEATKVKTTSTGQNN